MYYLSPCFESSPDSKRSHEDAFEKVAPFHVLSFQHDEGEHQHNNCCTHPDQGLGGNNDERDEFHKSSLNVDALFALERVYFLTTSEPPPTVEALKAIE